MTTQLFGRGPDDTTCTLMVDRVCLPFLFRLKLIQSVIKWANVRTYAVSSKCIQFTFD